MKWILIILGALLFAAGLLVVFACMRAASIADRQAERQRLESKIKDEKNHNK